MNCIKTGCHVYSVEYNEYLYGDAFAIGGVWVFRIAQRSRLPLSTRLHFRIYAIAEWFDKNADGSKGEYGTLIATAVENLGYEGEPLA